VLWCLEDNVNKLHHAHAAVLALLTHLTKPAKHHAYLWSNSLTKPPVQLHSRSHKHAATNMHARFKPSRKRCFCRSCVSLTCRTSVSALLPLAARTADASSGDNPSSPAAPAADHQGTHTSPRQQATKWFVRHSAMQVSADSAMPVGSHQLQWLLIIMHQEQ
jgi:hypothetical protein